MIDIQRLIFCVGCSTIILACGSGKAVSSKSPSKELYISNKYATQIGVSPKEITNFNLYSLIDSWYGVPYRFGGTTKSGIDCSSFVNLIYKNVYNKQLSRTTDDIYNSCRKISKGSLIEGDLVFFNINGKHSHVGVYLANNKFVHASSSQGVVISDLNNPYYEKNYGSGARVKN